MSGPLELWSISDLGELWLATMQSGRVADLQLHDLQAASSVGAIFKARVTGHAQGVGAAFVSIGQARDAFLMASRGSDSFEVPPVGSEILVQVIREPDGGKGTRVSPTMTIPGWSLVLTPGTTQIGVSRRIVEIEERQRLHDMLQKIAPPESGLIARTAAQGADLEELIEEKDRLLARWNQIQARAASMRAPARLAIDDDPTLAFLRDRAALAPERVVLAGPFAEERREAIVRAGIGIDRVEIYSGPLPAVEALGLDRELEAALRSSVALPSGGRLVIESTEALTAVDVNSGSDFSGRDIESTALHTNLEAAEEVARQIRLRDLAGMIVIDFIDMQQAEHRTAVEQRLGEALALDRAKLRRALLSEFCLAQITRQRRRPPLARLMTAHCQHCREGQVARVELAARRELRRVRREARTTPHAQFAVNGNEETLEVARELLQQWGESCGLPDRSKLRGL